MVKPVIIGNATLYLGDCLEILPTLPKVDAVITDPPYGVNFSGKNTKHTARNEETYPDHGFTPAMAAAVSHEARSKLIFCGMRLLHDYPRPDSIGGVFTPSGAGRDRWGFSLLHPILYYGKCPYMQKGLGGRPNGFQSFDVVREEIDHPCPKPLAWMLWAVNRASLPGECVLDPFAGSGTTGVACVHAGRKFIGIEIEPKYFDIACERIENAQRQQRMFE